jgi:hypothetical protein
VLRELLPLRVSIHDALTGRPVEPRAFGVSLDAWIFEPPAGAGGRRRLVVASDQDRLGLSLRIVPPEGYLFVDSAPLISTISAYARALEARVPLRRELELVVVVRDHTGELSDAGIVQSVRAAGSKFERPRVEVDGFGNRLVRGIPHFSREPVIVWVEIPGTTALGFAEGFMATDADAALTLTVDLPEPEPAERTRSGERGAIGIGGGGASSRGQRRAPRDGRIRVHVERFNGEPAAGAAITLVPEGPDGGYVHARTDEHGRARIDAVRVGRYRVTVSQPGLLPITSESVELTAEAEVHVELRERRGAALDLTVVDDLGAPLPYARVRFLREGREERRPIPDGPVQRVDAFADHRGVRSISRLSPEVGQVEVVWGSRRKVVPVTLEDGQRTRIEVELPAHRSAPR